MNASEFLLECAELCPTKEQEDAWDRQMEDRQIRRYDKRSRWSE